MVDVQLSRRAQEVIPSLFIECGFYNCNGLVWGIEFPDCPRTQFPQELMLPINIMELREYFLHWTPLLHGHLVKVQSDNDTAVAYINYQGDTRGL